MKFLTKIKINFCIYLPFCFSMDIKQGLRSATYDVVSYGGTSANVAAAI
jgi:hypothetical protein